MVENVAMSRDTTLNATAINSMQAATYAVRLRRPRQEDLFASLLAEEG
jgi:hypothetical protein